MPSESDQEALKIIDEAIIDGLNGKDERAVRKFVQKDWIFNVGWNLVQSSTIHEIKYDISEQKLYVRFYDSNPKSKNFRSMTEYEYYNVPAVIATDLLVTEYMNQSVGRKFYQLVKGTDRLNPPFKYNKLPDPKQRVPKSEVFEERADNPNAKRVKINKNRRNIVDRSHLMKEANKYIKQYNVTLGEAIQMVYDSIKV